MRSRVVANVDGITLGRFILHNADPTGSTLVTNKWKGYLPIGEQFAKHERVDHDAGTERGPRRGLGRDMVSVPVSPVPGRRPANATPLSLASA